MSKKHYDNKTDILRQMKENRIRAGIAAASAFSANMLMSLYVLRDGFGFGQERAERFVNGMLQLNKDFNDGKITLDEIKRRVYEDLGMVVEMPVWRDTDD